MTAKIVGNKLVIEIEMRDPPTPSATGKTRIVATTAGNVKTDIQVQGKTMTIGLNAYIPAT
jgi:hypothetical protein